MASEMFTNLAVSEYKTEDNAPVVSVEKLSRQEEEEMSIRTLECLVLAYASVMRSTGDLQIWPRLDRSSNYKTLMPVYNYAADDNSPEAMEDYSLQQQKMRIASLQRKVANGTATKRDLEDLDDYDYEINGPQLR